MDYEQDGEIFEAFKSKLNKREQTADLQRRRALGRKRKADFKTCAVLGDLVLQLSRQKPSVAEFFLQMLNERSKTSKVSKSHLALREELMTIINSKK